MSYSKYNSKENDEEFNNFLIKVNEVSNIIEKLSSNDENLQKIGDLEAEKYLNNRIETEIINIDNAEQIELKIKSNRTVINKKGLKERAKNPNEMSQEAFMSEMSRDAEKRYKNRMIRKEKMETFKKQAMFAFRRKEYEKALSYYNKAIEQIKDSPLLYQNRALTYLNLKFYDKAILDCETGLKFNDSSLKTWLLLAKAQYLNGNQKEFTKAIKEARKNNPDQEKFITEYVENLRQIH